MKDSVKTLRTMQNAKEKAKKIGYACGAAALTVSAYMPFAFAAADIGSIISTFLGYVVDIFVAIGILLAVWAAGQLVLAFKNEDADSKSKAMMMLIVAAALVCMRVIAGGVITALDVGGISLGKGFFG